MVKKLQTRMSLKVYVEGGGDTEELKSQCRAGFSQFLEKAGLKGKMPRIVASGSRKNAFENYKQALKEGNPAFLLVDSESSYNGLGKWAHVQQRDQWEKPPQGTEDDLHLMVHCMEAWLISDPATLKEFFGDGFKEKDLPAPVRLKDIEAISKPEIYSALEKATKGCTTKGQYGKGAHSFKLLGLIDPQKVAQASAQAQQFLHALKQRMA